MILQCCRRRWCPHAFVPVLIIPATTTTKTVCVCVTSPQIFAELIFNPCSSSVHHRVSGVIFGEYSEKTTSGEFCHFVMFWGLRYARLLLDGTRWIVSKSTVSASYQAMEVAVRVHLGARETEKLRSSTKRARRAINNDRKRL